MSIVTLKTSLGDIKIELADLDAPKTVENFLQYVNDGFYNGTIFHRVIGGFMVQGGGFDAEFKQKETRPTIENEAGNGLENRRGTLAMARTPHPHSASAQFFINLTDNNFLNFSAPTMNGFGYCVFGKVIEGMDIVDQIAKVKTTSKHGHQDVPADNVMILSATAE